MSFSGTRLVGRRVGAQGVLADLRRGRLPLFDTFGSSPLRATVDETLAASDGVALPRHIRHTPQRRRSTGPVGPRRAHAVRRTRASSRAERSTRSAPAARAPRPRTSSGPPADGRGDGHRRPAGRPATVDRLPPAELRSAAAYSGERSGSVVLSLSLVRSRGVTRRVTLFHGRPRRPGLMRRLRAIVLVGALACVAPAPAAAQRSCRARLRKPRRSRPDPRPNQRRAHGPVPRRPRRRMRSLGAVRLQRHRYVAPSRPRSGRDQPDPRPPSATTSAFLPASERAQLPGGVTTADVALDATPPVPGSHCVDAVHRAGYGVPGASGPRDRLAGGRHTDPAPDPLRRAAGRGRRPRAPGALALPGGARARTDHRLTGGVSHPRRARLQRLHQLHARPASRRPRAADSTSTPAPASGRGVHRVREIDVGYHATIGGTVSEVIRGAINPLLCGPLGSCGTSGTITLTPRARGVRAALSAEEPATDPAPPAGGRRAGARPGPGRDRIRLRRLARRWLHPRGPDPGTEAMPRCCRARPLGLLVSALRRLRSGYVPGSVLGGGPVTHCPGPLSASARRPPPDPLLVDASAHHPDLA